MVHMMVSPNGQAFEGRYGSTVIGASPRFCLLYLVDSEGHKFMHEDTISGDKNGESFGC
jgi:hypothetical protein